MSSYTSDAYFIGAPADYVKEFGLAQATLLYYLKHWCERSSDGWCFRTQAQIEDYTTIKPRTQHNYLKSDLSDVVECEVRGGRNFYRVNSDRIGSLFSDQQILPDGSTDQQNLPDGAAKFADPNRISTELVEERNTKERKGPDWSRIYDQVMTSWNIFAKSNDLSVIQVMTEERKKGVRAKYNELWPQIGQVYEGILASDFLSGRSMKFKADFDFVWVRKSKWIKVLEGGTLVLTDDSQKNDRSQSLSDNASTACQRRTRTQNNFGNGLRRGCANRGDGTAPSFRLLRP